MWRAGNVQTVGVPSSSVQVPADTLVRAALRASGARGPTDLAKSLGLPGLHSPKRVERWLRGENAPDYEQTMRLLELAGWLNERQVVAALDEAASEARAAERKAVDLRAHRRGQTPREKETG